MSRRKRTSWEPPKGRSIGGRRGTHTLAWMGPSVELSGGAQMPVLGLGVWQMAAGRETEQAVEWALEAGYRSIDTAALYKNERSVGAAIRRSGLPREQVFVTTKLMPARFTPDRAL